MNERPDNVNRRTPMKKLVAALAAVIVAVVLLDDNKCCPDCEGCGNNWECAVAVLSAISGCCGTGGGTARCESGEFCVTCDAGGYCGCTYDR